MLCLSVPEEAQQGAVKLKDMKDGAEQTVSLDEAVRKLQGGKS
jgi:histidyl-tRNA synthetase